jgi:hypothetical protein
MVYSTAVPRKLPPSLIPLSTVKIWGLGYITAVGCYGQGVNLLTFLTLHILWESRIYFWALNWILATAFMDLMYTTEEGAMVGPLLMLMTT